MRRCNQYSNRTRRGFRYPSVVVYWRGNGRLPQEKSRNGACKSIDVLPAVSRSRGPCQGSECQLMCVLVHAGISSRWALGLAVE